MNDTAGCRARIAVVSGRGFERIATGPHIDVERPCPTPDPEDRPDLARVGPVDAHSIVRSRGPVVRATRIWVVGMRTGIDEQPGPLVRTFQRQVVRMPMSRLLIGADRADVEKHRPRRALPYCQSRVGKISATARR